MYILNTSPFPLSPLPCPLSPVHPPLFIHFRLGDGVEVVTNPGDLFRVRIPPHTAALDLMKRDTEKRVEKRVEKSRERKRRDEKGREGQRAVERKESKESEARE